MNRTERLYRIDQLLRERRVVAFETLLEELEVSRATLKRDLEYLRSRLHAPIVWSREAGGYHFASAGTGPAYALPGLWFSEREIHALLTMEHLLAGLGADGLLTEHIAPLRQRLDALLASGHDLSTDIRQKVVMVTVARRPLPLVHFQTLGHALTKGVRVQLAYQARSTDETTERLVSPLRLVHYRDNWYLDAWCHLRQELRNFSVDKIVKVQLTQQPARKVSQKTIANALGSGYGIFAQGKVQWAQLRFSAYRARWVATEQWHPEQRGHFQPDGAYLLEVPYVDDRELVMDILRFGGDCEVVGPSHLRVAVCDALTKALRQYKK